MCGMGHPPEPKEKVGMSVQCVCHGSRECDNIGACNGINLLIAPPCLKTCFMLLTQISLCCPDTIGGTGGQAGER